METQQISIPGYEIEDRLARGGMATVFRARQLSLGRPVAIKVLSESLQADPRFVERFRREASLQAMLEHPNIVPLLESGFHNGEAYIVMRLIDGPSLRELISAEATTPTLMLFLLADVASALDFAHVHGVLHQDVKPHNILVEAGIHAWLADFGLTRLLEESTGLTHTSTVVGTFDYLAPEIAQGQRATAASDIYSLAVTTFQGLTGRLPFPAAHHAAAVLAHTTAPRPSASELAPELPPGIDPVLKRGMAIDPSERPASALEFINELCAALDLPPREGVTGRTLPPDPDHDQERVEAPSWAPTAAPTARAEPHPVQRWRDVGRARAARTVAMLAGVAALATVLAVTLPQHAGPTQPSHRTAASTGRPETVGGESHTWVNYRTATGAMGPMIPAHRTIRIACRVHGYRVQDGNTWWYRIASPPWNGRYYVSADAFYNNGHSTGSLVHTPFVDPAIPDC